MAPPRKEEKRKLKPLAPGLIELYALIAVLIVIIPEWIAQVGLKLVIDDLEKEIPQKSISWQSHPELLLSAMKLRELRQLALKNKLAVYSTDNREELIKRLFKKIKG